MDILTIEALSIQTIIGTLPWEREVKQTLRIDLEFATDCTRIAASDDIQDAIDYAGVTTSLVEFIENSSYKLIETLAEHVAQFLINTCGLKWCCLTVTKPACLEKAAGVKVTVERGSYSDD